MVDPRGQRFAAALTAAVLAVVLLTGSAWLLAGQAGVFAAAALGGVAASPYSRLFSRVIRPRLSPSAEYEDARPPRFAQAVGLLFAFTGLTGFLGGWTLLAYAAVGAALAAAFLNAAFGWCLGCEIYLAFRRAIPRLTEVTR